MSDADLSPIEFRRSARARRYRLTLKPDGTAVAIVPARGSMREAERFVERHRDWLGRARERQSRRPRAATFWEEGTAVLWRGEMTPIRIAALPPAGKPRLSLGSDIFVVRGLDGNLRPALEKQFLRRAKIELPARAWELAAAHSAPLKDVTVRNQRSRWGSCSARGVVSLNWRLVQAPESVRDYIICHELAHLWELNHSARFWSRVEALWPAWREAERWLKGHGGLVGL